MVMVFVTWVAWGISKWRPEFYSMVATVVIVHALHFPREWKAMFRQPSFPYQVPVAVQLTDVYRQVSFDFGGHVAVKMMVTKQVCLKNTLPRPFV